MARWAFVGSPTHYSPLPQSHRSPSRLHNAAIPTPTQNRNANDDGAEGQDNPPDYESHRFSPTHVMRLTFGPASRPRASEQNDRCN